MIFQSCGIVARGSVMVPSDKALATSYMLRPSKVTIDVKKHFLCFLKYKNMFLFF